MEFFTKDYIKGYFKRNQKFLIISLVIFVVAFVIGFISSFITVDGNIGLISPFVMSYVSQNANHNFILYPWARYFFL